MFPARSWEDLASRTNVILEAVRKWRSEARVLLGQPLHVFPHRALEAWIPQARGGVIGDQELGGAETIDLPPHGCHGSLGPDEQFGREFAEAADDLGTQDRELPQEIGRAGLDLVGQGIAVLRRTALQNVADVDGFTTDGDAGDELALVHGGENLGEQLAGAAYEGLAASILLGSRRFAHEHDTARAGAHAGHGLRAALREPALGTRAH